MKRHRFLTVVRKRKEIRQTGNAILWTHVFDGSGLLV
jgi:hypothetical protein